MSEGSASSPGRGTGHPWVLYALVTAVYLLWGANFVVSKIALREIPGPLAAGLRTAIAAVLLMLIHRMTRGTAHAPIRRGELPKLCLIGTMGIAVNQLCFMLGVSLTSAGHAAMVIGLTPFMVLALAWFRKQEKIGLRRVLGITIALGGLVLLQSPGSSKGTASLAGDLLILGAGASFALYTVFGKELAEQHGSMAVIAVSYVAGGIILSPLTFFWASSFEWSRVSLGGWLSFAYMTIVSSGLCYIAWAYALRRLSASRVSTFSYLQPLVATIMALPLLGEPITASLVSGGSLIMAGVFLSERG